MSKKTAAAAKRAAAHKARLEEDARTFKARRQADRNRENAARLRGLGLDARGAAAGLDRWG